MKVSQLITSLLIALTSLYAAADVAPGKPSPTTHPESVHSSCPATEITGFIEKFRTAPEIQRQFTKTPLRYAEVIDPAAEPKPTYRVRYLKRTRLTFPVLRTTEQLRASGLTARTEQGPNQSFFLIETSAGEKNLGVFVRYTFSKHRNCWHLTEILNQST